jgi:hypothetical protein
MIIRPWILLLFVSMMLLSKQASARQVNAVEKLRRRATRVNEFGGEKLRAIKSRTVKLAQNIRKKLKHTNLVPWKEGRGNLQPPTVEVEVVHPETKMVARVVSWLLRRTMRLKNIQSDGLQVSVAPTSSRKLVRGDFGNVKMTFDSVHHPEFSVSGGGIINIKGMRLHMGRLFSGGLRSVKEPHSVGCDVTLTSDDLSRSSFVRELAQSVVDTVFERTLKNNVLDIVVTGVSVRDNRVVATGVVSMLADAAKSASLRDAHVSSDYKGVGWANVGFEASAMLGVKENAASVLSLLEPVVVLNPQSSLLRAQLPIPSDTALDMDLCKACEITRIQVRNGEIAFAASAPVSSLRSFARTHIGGRPQASTTSSTEVASTFGSAGGVVSLAALGLETVADAAIAGASTTAKYLVTQLMEAVSALYSAAAHAVGFGTSGNEQMGHTKADHSTAVVSSGSQSETSYYAYFGGLYNTLVATVGWLWA